MPFGGLLLYSFLLLGVPCFLPQPVQASSTDVSRGSPDSQHYASRPLIASSGGESGAEAGNASEEEDVRFGAIDVAGTEQSLWISREVEAEGENPAFMVFAFRDFTAVRERFFPRPIGQMTGEADRMIACDRKLHIFFGDGSHHALVPAGGSMRGMVPPRSVREAKLPDGVLPRVIFADEEHLYAVITTRQASSFFADDAPGAQPSRAQGEDPAESRSDRDVRSEESPDTAVLRRMEAPDPSAVKELVTRTMPTRPDVPLVIVRLDNDGWKYDRPAPAAMTLAGSIEAAWAARGFVGLLFRDATTGALQGFISGPASVETGESGTVDASGDGAAVGKSGSAGEWRSSPLAQFIQTLDEGDVLLGARFTWREPDVSGESAEGTGASPGQDHDVITAQQHESDQPPSDATGAVASLPEPGIDVLVQGSNAGGHARVIHLSSGRLIGSTRLSEELSEEKPVPVRSRFLPSLTAEEKAKVLACDSGESAWLLAPGYVVLVRDCVDLPLSWVQWELPSTAELLQGDGKETTPDGTRVLTASIKQEPSRVEPLIPREFTGLSPLMQNIINSAILALSLMVVFVWRRDRLTLAPELAPGQIAASGSQRILAALVDFFILAPVGIIALVRFTDLGSAWAMESLTVGQDAGAGATWIRGSFGLAFGLYGFLFEASIGATPGKRLLGLSVVRPGGSSAGVVAILVRNVARVVEFHFYPLLLLVFVTRGRQRLGDLMVGTYVVEGMPADRNSGDDDGPPPTDHFRDGGNEYEA